MFEEDGGEGGEVGCAYVSDCDGDGGGGSGVGRERGRLFLLSF